MRCLFVCMLSSKKGGGGGCRYAPINIVVNNNFTPSTHTHTHTHLFPNLPSTGSHESMYSSPGGSSRENSWSDVHLKRNQKRSMRRTLTDWLTDCFVTMTVFFLFFWNTKFTGWGKKAVSVLRKFFGEWKDRKWGMKHDRQLIETHILTWPRNLVSHFEGG